MSNPNRETLPPYSSDLLDMLEEMYGRYEPTPDKDSDATMWWKLGQKSVVRMIRQLKQNAEDDVLNG